MSNSDHIPQVRQTPRAKALRVALLLSLAATALFSGKTLAAEPRIFWASDPVRPNETVLVQGSDLGAADATVELARLDDGDPGSPGKVPDHLSWTRIAPLQPAADSLKFVIPADWKNGLFACRVSTGGATSATLLLNAPDPWWLQGDEGAAATRGGWLRIFGKNLSTGSHPSIRLEPESGAPTILQPSSADNYALRLDVPAALPPGKYTVRVHSGAGGPAGWREAGSIQIQPPPPAVAGIFSVLESYGADAVPEMRKSLVKYTQPVDRTEGIHAALAKAAANGGGVVYFPAGRYLVKGALTIPPHTILRGEGEGVVTLWWGSGHFNLDGGGPQGRALVEEPKPPQTLIEGPDFALEEMSLFLPFEYVQGIAAEKRLRMNHVRVRVDHYWLVQGRGGGVVARLGQNFAVTNCDILAKGDALAPGDFGIIAHNRVAANKSNTPMGGGQQLIVEDNQFESMDPTAYQNISSEGRNIYYARNRHEALYAQQSDYSFTFDAGTGAYLGAIAEAKGTQLTLAADPTYPKWAPETSPHWRRSAVFILGGRGAGQWRTVTANHGRVWEIDRPFDVPPDASSTVSIVFFNGRVLVIGNHFEDANWVNAGYGTSVDVICAQNHLARCAELMNHGVGADPYTPHGFEPSWHVQYFDNEIAEGQTSIGSSGAGHNAANLFPGPLTWCAIHRRHSVAADNSGSISIGGHVRDVIVEGNHFANPLSTIKVDGTAQGVLLRNNHFPNDSAPSYEGPGIKAALVEKSK
jgi:hypothetical protein